MSTPYNPINETDLRNAPEIVEHTYHWISLLGLKVISIRDQRDGAWVYILLMKDAPDFYLEFDALARNILVYSNILTEVNATKYTKEFCFDFFIEILHEQATFPKVRIISLDNESNPLKIFSRYYTSKLSMELTSELIRENITFLESITDMIVKFDLEEVWRTTEGEPHLEKNNIPNSRIEYL